MAAQILYRAPGIAGHLLLNLRDASRHGDRAAFRWNMQRMGRELGSALAQSWPMADASCTTPLGTATERVPAHQPVLACILRASMPLHQGVMDVWDAADGAFVSAYRKHHDSGFDIEIEYLGAPSMEGRAVPVPGGVAEVQQQVAGNAGSTVQDVGSHEPKVRCTRGRALSFHKNRSPWVAARRSVGA